MIPLYIILQSHIRRKLYVNGLLKILCCWIIIVFAYKLQVGVYNIQPTSIPSLQPSTSPTTHPSMNKTDVTFISSNVITKIISRVAIIYNTIYIWNTIPTSIGNVAEEGSTGNIIRNKKTISYLVLLKFRNIILMGSFSSLIESFVDLVTLDLHWTSMFGVIINESFVLNQNFLFLFDNHVSANIPQRLYDLHLNFFLFNPFTVDECNCAFLVIYSVLHIQWTSPVTPYLYFSSSYQLLQKIVERW
jgi:hypothetical protein